MKSLSIFPLIVLFILTSCTNKQNLTTQETITKAIIKNDKASVAKLVEYPFPLPYPLKPILNEQEFILHYDRIITPELREVTIH